MSNYQELIANNQKLKLLILTRPKTSRAFPPDKLLQEADKYQVPAIVCQDIPAAITRAREAASEDDLICLSGSLYVVAEVLEGWAAGIGIVSIPPEHILPAVRGANSRTLSSVYSSEVCHQPMKKS